MVRDFFKLWSQSIRDCEINLVDPPKENQKDKRRGRRVGRENDRKHCRVSLV